MAIKTKVAAYRIPLLMLTVALAAMLLASCSGNNNTNTTTVLPLPAPSTTNNTVPVTVGITPSGGYVNGVFTSVTVCTPAVLPVGQNPIGNPPPPPTCQTIDNILVDTNTVGLRLLETNTVDGLGLPVVTDINSNTVQECVEFADFSYVWGPVVRATIQMAGETAAQVPLPNEYSNTGIPIQIITEPLYVSAPAPANCLSSPLEGGMPIAANTLQTLGANGILGVGSFLQDCGPNCASSTPPNRYYICPSGLCSVASVPQDLQLWNPVAAFAYDNNGVLLNLPGVDVTGSGPVTGSLIFGIGTQSNNALGEAAIYAIDAYGNFPQVTLTEQLNNSTNPPILFVSYLSPQNGSYIDSGSPANYFSDAQSLAIPECPDLDMNGSPLGLYCPSSSNPLLTLFSAEVYGTNHTQTNLTLNVWNAATLLNSGNSVFNSLGGDSGIDVSTDYVDLGLPFFLGHEVFVGFAGTATAYPPAIYNNGYWAF